MTLKSKKDKTTSKTFLTGTPTDKLRRLKTISNGLAIRIGSKT